ncbi:major capsid protein [Escherichia coli]|uniref:major capsid protein n=1 Tax=Escherichia coli TaxID=562 RepID=UPI0038910AB5
MAAPPLNLRRDSVKPKYEVNPQMTLRRLPDEDPQNLADPAYRRRRIIMQNMRDEELAIAQVEEMQAVSCLRANTP